MTRPACFLFGNVFFGEEKPKTFSVISEQMFENLVDSSFFFARFDSPEQKRELWPSGRQE